MPKDRSKPCTVEGCQNRRHYNGVCKEHFVSHSWRNHPFKNAWTNMKARCDNPNFPQAKDYSERLIQYCPAWKTFGGFYADMWSSWKEGLTLERKDNDGDYTPENCVWATRAEQSRNTRVSKLTAEQAAQVVERRRQGASYHQLQSEFGVEHHVIADVLRTRSPYANA